MEKLYYITRTLKVFVLTSQDVERYGYGELPEALKQEIAEWGGGVSTEIVLVTDDNVHALKAESGWDDDSCVFVNNRGAEITLPQALAISKKSVAEQRRLERGIKLGDLVRVQHKDPTYDDTVAYVVEVLTDPRTGEAVYYKIASHRVLEHAINEHRFEMKDLLVVGDGFKEGVRVGHIHDAALKGSVKTLHPQLVLVRWDDDGSKSPLWRSAVPYSHLVVLEKEKTNG